MANKRFFQSQYQFLLIGKNIYCQLGLQGEGLVWLIGAVVCLLAALWLQLSISMGSGWPHNVLWYR